jgi:16S rRNA (guanine527-N7)-methyltransferase
VSASLLSPEPESGIAAKLNRFLAESGQPALDPAQCARFAAYYALLHRWNARINLTAIRTEDEILRRHFAESIACARAIPASVRTLLDFGSGAGFPGLPIALCSPEIAVVLAESRGKKAAFLREAVRTLEVPVEVFGDRAEQLGRRFDCVTLRAVDRMDRAVSAAAELVAPSGWLALLTTGGGSGRDEEIGGARFAWAAPVALASGTERILLLGRNLGQSLGRTL